jgi:hypothetical protein
MMDHSQVAVLVVVYRLKFCWIGFKTSILWLWLSWDAIDWSSDDNVVDCIHDSMVCILCCTDNVCTWTSSFELVECVSKSLALLNKVNDEFLLFEYTLNLTSGRKKLYTINKSVNQDSWIRFYPIGNLIVVDLFLYIFSRHKYSRNTIQTCDSKTTNQDI